MSPSFSPPPGDPGAPVRIQLELLMQGRKEVVLLHNQREYRLRITQTGKLILTT